jgi:hypothetical protein
MSYDVTYPVGSLLTVKLFKGVDIFYGGNEPEKGAAISCSSYLLAIKGRMPSTSVLGILL